MRYQVPQFIEIEDKIFGPLTFKQFVYVAGSVGMVVVLYSFWGLFWTVIIGTPFALLGVALAFLKINNRPFIYMVEAAVRYIVKNRLYIWKKRTPDVERQRRERKKEASVIKPYVPKVSENKLKELAWSLDIKESLYENPEQVK